MNSDVPNLDLETPNPAPAQPVAKTAREEVSKSESEPVGTRESDPVRKWESEKSRAPHLRTCLLLLALVIGHWSLVISAPAATPPIITTQPQPSTNLTATEVIFTVHATGTEPLRYQWYYTPPPPSTNITPFALPGETNTTLIYTNLGAFQKGYYTVTITNAAGALTSNPVYLTIHIPPLVTRQPAHLTAPVGGTATFAITATGDAPLRYQWFFNIIEEIIGATNAILTLTNLQKIHTGTYQIEASNDYDTVNSIEAQLTVKDPALITTPPASQNLPTGSPAHFTVLHTGDGPFAYQWYFNATTPLFGATNNTLTLANAQLAHTGDYTVHITTPGLGTITSTPPARLTILQAPALTQQPQGTAANLGSNVTFTAAGTGTAPLNFQWRYNGLAIPGATNSEPAILNVQRSTLALQNVQPAQAGLYTLTINNPLGASTSLQASLTVYLPPTLTTAPTNQTVRAGQTATLAATATGTSPLTYRWYFNNTPLPNAPFPTLTLQNVQLAHAGNYTLTVSNLAGLVTSPAARLTVASPPVILQQPVSRAILPGGAPTFTVQAAGDAPLAFQWYYNGTPLPGATNSEPVTTNLFDSQLSTPRLSTLTLQNAQPTDAGLYTVRITNALGSVSSAAATLAIQQPPTITSPPASLTLTQGNSATFSVTVTGDGPMHYRWLQNGTNLLDPQLSTPRLSTLTLSNVQPAAAGNYTVIVTNEVGTATSSEARLIVRTPPAILQQPRSLFVAPGGSATFTLSATGEAPLTYQWSFNGTPLPEATNVTFTVANITPAADGLYTLTISNQIGTITSTGAALQVRTPPLITTQPVSLTTTQGQNATFRVQASGDGPLTFQWYFNATNLLDSQLPTLTLSNVSPAAAGPYTVRITNPVGLATSAPALLTIRLLPILLQQPVSLTLTQGQNATLTLSATSQTPLTFQWRYHGLPIPGATNNEPATTNLQPSTFNLQRSTYTLQNAQPTDAGLYDAIVANTYGTVTSTLARLTLFGLDFGDAPEPAYPTRITSNGARHVIVPGIHLGNLIDAEPDGQPAPTATGDNATGVNDEDGVRFTSPLHLGQTARLEVIASTNGQLSAWIDFNHEGGWAQANEQVLASVALQPGTNLLTLSIPADAALGHTVARFRFSTTADLTPTGLALDGEVEDYSVNVAPAADLVLTQTLLDSQLLDSQLSTLTLHATNHGPSAATSVLLTHLLSRRSTYVSAISSQGNCTHLNGVVTCALGTLPTGAGISVTLTTTIGQGTNTSATTIRADEFDPSPADANATSTIIGTSRTPQFANSDIILMPLPDAGAADPYPAGIIVSGVTGAVHQLTVTLRGLSHDYPDDIDILLVGPHGQAVILMSDAGFDHPIVDATITFDDLLGQPLPDSIPAISTGSYRPFNHAPADDSFPAPAPAGPYSADLSAFRSTDPNGLWSLYVIDDSLDNGGSDVPGFIADGWSLNMLTAEPLADLGVTVTASSGLVSIGEAITYSISITNHGPTASSALCHYSLPPSLNFISTPQGACSLLAGVITCDLGEIAPGSSVTFSITTAASIGGGVSNVFTVTGSALDLFTSNNSAPASLFVRPLVNLALAASAPASPFLLLQPSLYFVSLTNHGPNVATGVWLTNLLPFGATYLSSSTSQGSCSAIGQTVLCSLGVVPVGASPSLVVRFAPGSLGLNRAFSQVASEEEDSSPGDNSRVSLFTVEPACDLAISSAATGATVPLNGDYVVTLSVTNLGPLAVDAALTDTLPATTSFVSAFTTRGACTNAGNLVRCDFLNLAPGEGASVILRARATALGALTNVATVTGSLPDVDLANNGATHLAMVVPNSNLALGISDRPNPVWLGENLTYLIAVTNLGPSAAANVVLTNQLPAGIAFVSANATQGSCSRLGDVVRCELGAMAVNATLTVSITARPPQAGFITNSALVFASTDVEGSDNGAAKVTRVISGNVNLANSTALSIPFLGLANPYPSTITVSGLSSAIFRLRVSLLNLSHTFADDLDVLLVGPDGRACWLMSDAGGEFALSNVSLTFDDAATNALGDSSPNSSGTVRPANFGTEAESFAAPAPAGPYATNLSIFHGSDPNGTWSLYIMDDAEKDSGALAGGWRLTISAFEPLADLAVAQVAAPNPVGTGSNVVFTCTVSNLGPSIASGVRLTHSFPAGLVVTGFTNAHGACTSAGGRLVCDMGSLVPGGSGALSVWATALVPGTFTNVAGVAFDGVDLRLTNNAAAVAVTFVLPPVITLQPVSQTVALGGSVQFAAAASGAAPLAFQWHFNGVPVAGGGGQGSEFGIQNVQLAQAGSYRVRVSNAVGAAWSEPALLLIPGPPSLSFLPNLALDEDSNSGPISFTVQDFDTPAASLVLSAASSNLQLVPAAGLSFGGEGQNRTVRIAPAANASGSTTITVWVRDTTGAATTNVFTVVVRPVLDPIVVLMQPRHRLSVTGATVVLSVSAGSDLPVAFQWFFQGGQGAEVRVQGTEVSGQSSGGRGQGSEFRVQNIQSTNAGEYRVQLSSADTNVWSATARVVVTNSLPVPNIVSISQQGAQASVTFSTVVGLTYRLEFKRFLEDTAWSALGSIEGTGRSEILTDPAAGGAARFYRVRAE